MPETISSPFRLEVDVRGSVAGRGALVESADDLRGDFATALREVLCEGETPVMIFAVRSDRVLRRAIPATVLALTERALLVLREPPRVGETLTLGVRVSVLALRALAGLELGHAALSGTLQFGLFPARRTVLTFSAYDVRGGAVTVRYHALDEEAIATFTHRVREVANV